MLRVELGRVRILILILRRGTDTVTWDLADLALPADGAPSASSLEVSVTVPEVSVMGGKGAQGIRASSLGFQHSLVVVMAMMNAGL